MTACDACLRRTALIAALSGHLDVEWRKRDATARVLALPDEDLLALAPGAAGGAYARFDASAARERAQRARLAVVCRCEDAYPQRLRELADPPAVLHVAGSLPADEDAVAIVGARRATAYGLEVARALGRGREATARRGSRPDARSRPAPRRRLPTSTRLSPACSRPSRTAAARWARWRARRTRPAPCSPLSESSSSAG